MILALILTSLITLAQDTSADMERRLMAIKDPNFARHHCGLTEPNWAKAFKKVAKDMDKAKEKCLLEDAPVALAAKVAEQESKKTRLQEALDGLKTQNCASLANNFQKFVCAYIKEKEGL